MPQNDLREEDIPALVRQEENASTRMYESNHPEDDRDDALSNLSRAIDIARRFGLTEQEARLRERYAPIDAVFNTQFRW